MSRIGIFTGHFGSGKTEIAINYAIKLPVRNVIINENIKLKLRQIGDNIFNHFDCLSLSFLILKNFEQIILKSINMVIL